nr:ribonuclease H-like domain-containing protein [Tanacetum cinerariifolium]
MYLRSDIERYFGKNVLVNIKDLDFGILSKSVELENTFLAAEDEGIFDSGCSRSMTGNKKRLDDFQAFHGGKVTFGGGEGRITGKGTIRTPTLDFENVYCWDFTLRDDIDGITICYHSLIHKG